MCTFFRRRVVTALGTLLLGGGCVEGPPSSVTSTGPLRTAEDGGGVRVATNPVGTFRTSPAAVDQLITVNLGDEVGINGARFVPGERDDELKVEAGWGDGTTDAVGCGPCRLSHVYRGPGTYVLSATIHNRRLVDRGSVTQVFHVSVQDPHASPPADCSIRPGGDIWDGFLNPATGIKMCRCPNNGRELPWELGLPGDFTEQCLGNGGTNSGWGPGGCTCRSLPPSV